MSASLFLPPNRGVSIDFSVTVTSSCGGSQTLTTRDGYNSGNCDQEVIEPESGAGISASPNPTNGLIDVQLDSFVCSGYRNLELVNSFGIPVLNTQFDGMYLTLDLSGLPEGLYHMKVHSEECYVSQVISKTSQE